MSRWDFSFKEDVMFKKIGLIGLALVVPVLAHFGTPPPTSYTKYDTSVCPVEDCWARAHLIANHATPITGTWQIEAVGHFSGIKAQDDYTPTLYYIEGGNCTTLETRENDGWIYPECNSGASAYWWDLEVSTTEPITVPFRVWNGNVYMHEDTLEHSGVPLHHVFFAIITHNAD